MHSRVDQGVREQRRDRLRIAGAESTLERLLEKRPSAEAEPGASEGSCAHG